jgi:hypothetical protein
MAKDRIIQDNRKVIHTYCSNVDVRRIRNKKYRKLEGMVPVNIGVVVVIVLVSLREVASF